MNPQFKLTDTELGHVYICVNARARHLILRIQADARIVVTVPPLTPEPVIRNFIDRYRADIRQQLQAIPVRPIDRDFSIQAPHFRFTVAQNPSDGFLLRTQGHHVELLCPAGTRFDHAPTQEWLHKVVLEALRKQARRWLPPRLGQLSACHGLPYRSVKVNTSQGRWGSCSTRKDINLSCYLLLLPDPLVDYVLLHELCHTLEMNHSERFWALLNRLTDGQAQALRHELGKYTAHF